MAAEAQRDPVAWNRMVIDTMAVELGKLSTPEDAFAALDRFASTTPPVAECFRCGAGTPFDAAIGEPCQRDGCDGRYVKT